MDIRDPVAADLLGCKPSDAESRGAEKNWVHLADLQRFPFLNLSLVFHGIDDAGNRNFDRNTVLLGAITEAKANRT